MTTTNPLNSTIEEISPKLRLYAAHATGTRYSDNLAEMDEAAQEAFQHAVTEILRTCKPGDKPAYLKNLANWRMANLREKNLLYNERLADDGAAVADDDDDIDGMIDMISDNNDPETIIIERESISEIEAVMLRLRPEYNVIIRLIRQGLGLPEISDRLGISYDAAWKRLGKIREVFSQAGISPAMMAA